MNISVNRELCIGCGACVATCPDNFEMDNENKAIIKTTSVSDELKKCSKEAAESCPVDAIILKD